jgi:hypothetical protein
MFKNDLAELSVTKMNPLIQVMKSVSSKTMDQLNSIYSLNNEELDKINTLLTSLNKAVNELSQEVRVTSRFKQNDLNTIKPLDEDVFEKIGFKSFTKLAFDCVKTIRDVRFNIATLVGNLYPKELILTKDSDYIKTPETFEQLQHLMFQFDLNKISLTSFLLALKDLDFLNEYIVRTADAILQNLNSYYNLLVEKHTKNGEKIFKDPVLTELASTIFANIDSHGEVNKESDKISAYSLRKAEIIASIFKDKTIYNYILNINTFIELLIDNLQDCFDTGEELNKLFEKQISSCKYLLSNNPFEMGKIKSLMSKHELEVCLTLIRDINPKNIAYRESNKILSKEEKFSLSFKEETIEKIVSIISDPNFNPTDLVQYVLERKAELNKFFQEDNSFYVCKIGSGNQFLGEAPGQLVVMPGAKPDGNFEEILGSNFDQVRNFAKSIQESAKWANLFLATSPSRTTDKSNILLVGPMGCGKTSALKAACTQKDSIAIFAQGSDFVTCWLGEASKNPKRLFEHAVKIQKESNKHVHILIDEIDSVLNDEHEKGQINLSLEFQTIMDGVVSYPNLSVWGTTNHPDRIPLPMLRRFNLCLEVGELFQEDRVKLLKHYISFMPNDISSSDLEGPAQRLDGATGDIIRKIADHIWREKMTNFVSNNKKEAKELTDLLGKESEFKLSDYTEKDRFNFNQRLSKYVKVSIKDIEKSIDMHLNNLIIRAQIETAKNTYKETKELLCQL